MKKTFLKRLQPACVVLGMQAATKDQAIDELLGRLSASGLVKDPARAREDVFARERMMSTGMQNGLAIPHAKTAGVDDLCLALGIKPEGVEFGSLDDQPARLIFLVLSCSDKAGPHIQCLAEITGACRDADVRERLLKARTPAEAIEILNAS